MKLEEYIKTHGLNYSKFAKMVGVSQVQIVRLINGERNPSSNLTHKIMKVTNKKVTFEDLFTPNIPSRGKTKDPDMNKLKKSQRG